MSYKPGDKVLWLWETHKGWGASWWVKATVVKVNPKRIRIAAELERGGTKEVNVKADKLKHRTA